MKPQRWAIWCAHGEHYWCERAAARHPNAMQRLVAEFTATHAEAMSVLELFTGAA